MKLLTLALFLMISFTVSPDLSKVRESYRQARNNEEIAQQLKMELSSVTKEDQKVLVAYKGAVTALMGKYVKKIKDKKALFKKGTALIEYAITEKPSNIEIRLVRLSVQENSPRILGYRDNIAEDKKFILDHYSDVSSQNLQEFIKGYVQQSSSFEDSEKQLF